MSWRWKTLVAGWMMGILAGSHGGGTAHARTVSQVDGAPCCDVGGTAHARTPAVVPAEPPHLLLSASDFSRINTWADEQAWADSARADILARADGWPESYLEKWQLERFELPPEGGQWVQYYVCPVHGYALIYVDATTHLCPEGETYSGWPYDQVIYTRRIDDASNAAVDLGLAYHLTGDDHYAEDAAEILEAFAATYLKWPIHDEHDVRMIDGARAHAQTLDEAVWLIPVAWAYDLIADSPALDDADRGRIQQLLLRPAARVLQHYKTKGNWQVWHNAGIAAVGYTLGDQALIDTATEDLSGMDNLIALGINDDGLWWEGTWSYHFYALQPFVWFAEMSRRAGRDYYADPRFAGLFTAPLDVLLPDLTLPPFNDSHAAAITSYAWAYEVAWSRLGDPRAAAIAGMVSRGRWGLFFGTETLPEEVLPEEGPVLLEDSGYAVLRQAGAYGTTYSALDFGPHGGWHGHFDKLSFISYGSGAQMGLDPGTQSYAAPTHDTWDKKTVAHNTVVMDGHNQLQSHGSLDWFHVLPDLSGVRADAGMAYPGARALRAQVLTAEYLLDRFDITAHTPARHTFDWVYHNPGTLSTDLSLEPYDDLPDTWGYQNLTDTAAATVTGPWVVDFSSGNTSGSGCRVWMDGLVAEGEGTAGSQDRESGTTTVITGNGLGPHLEPVPFVMARREGRASLFATLFEPYQQAPQVMSFSTRAGTTLRDGTVVLGVDVTGIVANSGDAGAPYDDQWALGGGDTGERWSVGNLSGDGDFAFVRRVDGDIRVLALAGGSLLSEGAQILIHAETRQDGIEARVGLDDTLEVWTESPLTAEVFIFGPGTTSVTLDGAAADWSLVGDMVWLPPQ